MTPSEWHSLLAGALAIVALFLLISRLSLHPFLALLLASLGVGAATHLPLPHIVQAFEAGMGGTLGHTATVIALGSMLGKLLASSGGAERIAHTLTRRAGPATLPWAMLAIGLLVGLPVFFEVGFVLLMPVAFTVARQSGQPLLRIALPLLAGLSIVHACIPPHPAATAAVAAFHADLGRTIAYALAAGLPAAVLAGPLFGSFIARRIHTAPGTVALSFEGGDDQPSTAPSFLATLATLLLPVALMLLGGWADAIAHPGTPANSVLHLLGHPDTALLAGLLLGFRTLGRGLSRQHISRLCGEGLLPTAAAVLLIGGGGGFSQVLREGHVADAAMHLASLAHLPLLLTGWLLAALLRIGIGSSTVAMITAASLVAPLALHAPHPELLAIATGAGSIIFSHVNDGGFWLAGQYLNLDVRQTLATWSVLETILSVTTLALALLLNLA